MPARDGSASSTMRRRTLARGFCSETKAYGEAHPQHRGVSASISSCEDIMALARCKDHPPDNTRAKSPYTAFALPLGHPNTGLICGRNKCRNAAYLWLNESEQGQYNEGVRIFQVGSLAVKIQVL